MKFKPVFCIFVFACLINSENSYALIINTILPQQIAKNTNFSIQPVLSTGETPARWVKMLGPDWVNVSQASGTISGLTPDTGEAHYIQIKAFSAGGSGTMTFILIVGSQNIFRMNGQDGNPASIQAAYSLMSAGDILIIPDGTYEGIENTINGSTGDCVVKNGNAGNYTTVIAENPNSANLPSVYHKGGEYIAYKGLELATGLTIDGDLRFNIRSNHIKVMMCGAMSGGFGAQYGATDILFEDCFAYGNSRAVFRIGSTGNNSDRIIFRRCVARHDLSTSSEPTATFMHYGGQNILFQNCIAIDQATDPENFAAAYDVYGAWETKNGYNIFVKDSIALNIVHNFHYGDTSTDNVRFSNCVFWSVGTANTSLAPNTVYDRLTIGNVNAQNTENTFTDRSGSTSVYFTNSIFHDIEGTGTETGYRSKTILYLAPESSNNLFNPVQADLTIGDTTEIITGIDPVDGNPGNGVAGILYPVKIEPASDCDTRGVGATILYRRGSHGALWGEQGYDELTGDSLWPWPNEDQIREKMAAYNYNQDGIVVTGARGFAAGNSLDGTPQTLTKYIWERLGNIIPPEIYTPPPSNAPDATPPAVPTGINVH